MHTRGTLHQTPLTALACFRSVARLAALSKTAAATQLKPPPKHWLRPTPEPHNVRPNAPVCHPHTRSFLHINSEPFAIGDEVIHYKYMVLADTASCTLLMEAVTLRPVKCKTPTDQAMAEGIEIVHERCAQALKSHFHSGQSLLISDNGV